MAADVETCSRRLAFASTSNATPMIQAMAAYFRAVAHPVRMRIVLALAKQGLTVRELVDDLRQAEPVISRHLGVLRRAGITCARSRPRNRLSDDTAIRVYELAGATKTLADPEWYL